MPTSEALKRAKKKYDSESIDRIPLRVPKGKKELIRAHATRCEESANAFINRAIDETIQRDIERKKDKSTE